MFRFILRLDTRVAENVSINQHKGARSIENSDPEDQFSGGVQILLMALMSLLIVITFLGNAFVFLAFIVDRRLRTQSNFFLLNLAICDFFVGIFSLPLYLKNYIFNRRWVLGKSMCKMWLVIDYLATLSSMYNIVLISYDRFLSVTNPVAYRVQQKCIRSTVVKMATVWILAFLLYGPAVIFWEYVAGYSKVPDGECSPEFFHKKYYLLFTSLFDFFSPLAVIIYFSLRIYLDIRQRIKSKCQQMKICSSEAKANPNDALP
ncbi:histamine H4 receptor [Microcaecilia unicolor]|uniref:Histamine H3 receptor-like n=1 Tax=Microcaecilia unicolor TaxID=1415580 RepID=A0A6P7X2F8_9AMPH|nr:histamine H3 receptor-like [Microcaecilia unicolor]